MRHRPEINFSASRRAPPRKIKSESGESISVDCSPRDDAPDYDLGFHCHRAAMRSSLKLWGLAQFNPILGTYDKHDIIHDEFFDETTNLAINARRYIEIFNDEELANHIVGEGDGKPLRYWDALGVLIHGQSFVASFWREPDSSTHTAIHAILMQSLDRTLTETEQESLRDLVKLASLELPLRSKMRLVGYTVATDKKKNQWISLELMSRVFLEQNFTRLTEWQRSAPDFRTPIEE